MLTPERALIQGQRRGIFRRGRAPIPRRGVEAPVYRSPSTTRGPGSLRGKVMRLLPIFLLLLPWVARSQVVNIENQRFEDDTSRWAAQFGFRLNVVENTQRSTDLGLNGGVQFMEGLHRAFLISDFYLTRVEDNAFTNTGFQHLRYQRRWRGPLFQEAYTQVQYNKPLRIDIRWLMGGGIRLEYQKEENLRLAAGTSILYEYEADHVNELVYNDIRSSNYLSVSFKVEPHVMLSGILYFQPVIADASDQRLTLEAQLRIRASRRYAFDTRLALQRDTKTAPDVPELNYRWSNVFTFLL